MAGKHVNDEPKELEFDGFMARAEVLETIAAVAATSVEGVVGTVGALGARGTPGRRSQTRGVAISTDGDRLSVSIHVSADYGVPMRELGEKVKEAVSEALYRMTGWPVAGVDVFIDDVRFEQELKER